MVSITNWKDKSPDTRSSQATTKSTKVLKNQSASGSHKTKVLTKLEVPVDHSVVSMGEAINELRTFSRTPKTATNSRRANSILGGFTMQGKPSPEYLDFRHDILLQKQQGIGRMSKSPCAKTRGELTIQNQSPLTALVSYLYEQPTHSH